MAHSVVARETQITLRDFLMVIFRRKWIILSMVAVTTTVVVSALMMAPVVYLSTSKMLVWGAQGGGPLDRTRIVLDSEQILSSESELITSQPILERAQEALNQEIASGKQKIVVAANRIKATPVQKSRILMISYSASTPEEAQRVCNAVTEAYVEYHKSLFAPPDLGGFFQGEIKRTGEKLSELMNRRLAVKEANDVVDVRSEMQSLFTVLTDYKIKLVEVERRLASLRSEIGDAAEARRNGSLEVPFIVSSPGAEYESMRFVLQELERLRILREQLLVTYTDRHPEVEKVDSQLAQAQAALTIKVDQITAHKKIGLASLESEHSLLRQRITETEERLRMLPAAERDIDETEKNIETLAKQYYNLYYMSANALASGPSIADYHVALVSTANYGVPTNPRDIVRMTLGPILSLLVGIGLAFFFDNLDHSLKNPEEVERYLGLPVLSSIKHRHTRELSI